MKSKKRQHSEAEQGGVGNARKRLAAFRTRMFELPQEDLPVGAPETPQTLLKVKYKKLKKKVGGGDDDEEVVSMLRLNVKKTKKGKKWTKERSAEKVEEEETTVEMAPAVVQNPGMFQSNGTKKKKGGKNTVQKKKKPGRSSALTAKKTTRVQTAAVQVPQSQSMETNVTEGDGSNPLEAALGSIKETMSNQAAVPSHEKLQKVAHKAVASSKVVQLKDCAETMGTSNSGEDPFKTHRKKQKKRKKNLIDQVAQKAVDSKLTGNVDEGMTNAPIGRKEVSATPSNNGSIATNSIAPSLKRRRKEKESSKVSTTSSESVLVKPKQDDSLVSDMEEDINKLQLKNAKMVPRKRVKTACKSALSSSTKASLNDESDTLLSLKSLTPIASSLVNDAKETMSAHEETPCRPSTRTRCIEKVMVSQVAEESLPESEEDDGFDSSHTSAYGDNTSVFSRLIDSAARERWELAEVGRLVRLFAAEWDFDGSKTAQFLCETCPELVSVDFLEGLGVSLTAEELIRSFEAGSGNAEVLMNKMASAVENGYLSVRDPVFVSALECRAALMESNAEVMVLLHPLLQSLSTVRDVGCLLKQLCEHWQMERKVALVQQILLSNVFDDLDGNQDDVLLDLPDLTGQLDFPSRLDQDDVDENGNLKGFLANEDSECSGEEGSEEELDENDAEDDDEENDSGSEEEVEISGPSRGRNQFIEDEADVGDEEEEEEEER